MVMGDAAQPSVKKEERGKKKEKEKERIENFGKKQKHEAYI